MDSFSFNNLQAEKANAILKHRKLRRVASLLRIIEVCAVLVLVSRFSMQLPVAVRNSGEYFRDLSLFMNSPRFVFLIGNIIIIALFAQFSAQGNNVVQEPNLYQELIQNTTKNQETVVAEYSRKKQRMKTGEAKISLEKGYRRCEREKRRGVMRRCESESEKGRKKIEGVAVEEVARPEDGMSNEEFRRTVEAFIAREQRIRREEDYYLL
ncbi:hypothetical protein PHAVU_011G043200 [Phaseolus vulgaris]|uniref:DUF4408 domain-containing protein n=1 Tax=Phaseolus vulgaris TaxID=3885 RepID=V7AG44_PHAVU|nr:hypothetical protein PHAVU_011G043200g [Phaseolus vulgaris]ESW03803.1 hypothetical protein PHAVU_011G043200g [Phaseolus vulgaris]